MIYHKHLSHYYIRMSLKMVHGHFKRETYIQAMVLEGAQSDGPMQQRANHRATKPGI